jgi:hypothetical protein
MVSTTLTTPKPSSHSSAAIKGANCIQKNARCITPTTPTHLTTVCRPVTAAIPPTPPTEAARQSTTAMAVTSTALASPVLPPPPSTATQQEIRLTLRVVVLLPPQTWASQVLLLRLQPGPLDALRASAMPQRVSFLLRWAATLSGSPALRATPSTTPIRSHSV